MNIPNSLSILRLLLIPVFCVTFLAGQDYYIYAGIALALSGLSDLLDGYFARKFNQITELGKWLDPIADKLTLGAVVVCMWLVFHEEYPELTPLFAILILKELAMAIGGAIVVHGLDEMVQSMIWGKIGTACFYMSMIIIVLMTAFDLGGAARPYIIIGLVALSVAFMLYAFIRYAIVGVEILRRKKSAKAEAEPEAQ